MDRIDVENFAKNLVLAMARSGNIKDVNDAVSKYAAFINRMDLDGHIDPDIDEDDDEEYIYE